MASNEEKLSRHLTKLLRHTPEEADLTLEPGGWVPVKLLIANCATKNGMIYTEDILKRIVANSDKQRFSFNDAGDKIRANQGHSIEIDLQLDVAVPPKVLYHGTATSNIRAIFEIGINKMSRHAVHLSDNMETATKVGSRHGNPVVLVVDSETMYKAGYDFFKSDNGVWLTDSVPKQYIALEWEYFRQKGIESECFDTYDDTDGTVCEYPSYGGTD